MTDENCAFLPAYSRLGVVSFGERNPNGWDNPKRVEKPTMDSRDSDGASTIFAQKAPCRTPSTQGMDRTSIPAERMLFLKRDQFANSDGYPWIP
jgi:hypothetical protein